MQFTLILLFTSIISALGKGGGEEEWRGRGGREGRKSGGEGGKGGEEEWRGRGGREGRKRKEEGGGRGGGQPDWAIANTDSSDTR
jgi:hypothetical protein